MGNKSFYKNPVDKLLPVRHNIKQLFVKQSIILLMNTGSEEHKAFIPVF